MLDAVKMIIILFSMISKQRDAQQGVREEQAREYPFASDSSRGLSCFTNFMIYKPGPHLNSDTKKIKPR